MNKRARERIRKQTKANKKNTYLLVAFGVHGVGSIRVTARRFARFRHCVLNNIFVTIIPGASSIISALQLSSIPINKYKFLGFVPKTKKGIGDFIELLKYSVCTSVFFISTHKILLFLEMVELAPILLNMEHHLDPLK